MAFRTAVLTVALVACSSLPRASADLIRVRHPEAPAHGFVVLSGEDGQPLAHGELEQSVRRDTVESRLKFHFEDGSTYDERVQFSQRRVFRIVSYHLVQRGPAFSETIDVTFDRTGRYRVRRRAAPDEDEEEASGRVELPDDVANGMISIACRNVMPDGAATVHVMSFLPKPQVLKVHIDAEGTDRFWVGPRAHVATRFRVKPEVGGVTGVLATLVGKQPAALRMWMARGPVPMLVKFEGPLYAEGPTWQVVPAAPRWDR